MTVSIFYVSDKAFGHLVHLAQVRGYVKWGAQRVKGLSEFLNMLSESKFTDTRPDLVRQRHEEEIRMGRAPTWLHTRTRRARNLQLSETAIENYLELAYKVKIIKDEPYTIGGPSRLTPQPSVSLVLEGIGLQWLTPKTLPSPYENKN